MSPVRTTIKNQAVKFFDNIPTIPNPILQNISISMSVPTLKTTNDTSSENIYP